MVVESGEAISVPWGAPIAIDPSFVPGEEVAADRCACVELERQGLGFHLRELSSLHGLRINGQRVRAGWAGPGANIQIGAQSLRVFMNASQSTAAMVGSSPAFRQFGDRLLRLASLSATVLIEGETGTGKELAAQALHDLGPRSSRPLIALNCAAIAEGLSESTLFGHRKGAFTGAIRDRSGAFIEASGGTLFLDEIAELPLPQQAKLLRALESRKITPVGAEREIEVDVRVVAATHRNLEDMVRVGRFREDLYHRLSTLELGIPPLRDRLADIPCLLDHFAQVLTPELGYRVLFTEDAKRAASQWSWPGNIRQLKNAVLRAGVLSPGRVEAGALIPRPSTVCTETQPVSGITFEVPLGSFPQMRRVVLQRSVAHYGSIRKASVALGISRSTFAKWLKASSGTEALL